MFIVVMILFWIIGIAATVFPIIIVARGHRHWPLWITIAILALIVTIMGTCLCVYVVKHGSF